MGKKREVKSKESSKDEKAWVEYLRQEDFKTPDRLEDAAKFMATMIAISLSVFLVINKKSGALMNTCPVKIALASWLLSLLLAFIVLLPFRYQCLSTSAKSIKTMHKKIVLTKWIFLTLSSLLFFVALCILVVRLL